MVETWRLRFLFLLVISFLTAENFHLKQAHFFIRIWANVLCCGCFICKTVGTNSTSPLWWGLNKLIHSNYSKWLHKEQCLAHTKCPRNVTYYYEILYLVPYFFYNFIWIATSSTRELIYTLSYLNHMRDSAFSVCRVPEIQRNIRLSPIFEKFTI